MIKLVPPDMVGRQTNNVTDWSIDTHWEENLELCSQGLHYYSGILEAGFLNPIHARIPEPRYFSCEPYGRTATDGLKHAAQGLKIGVEYLAPKIEQEHRIRLALLASLEVCSNNQWRAYAENYLLGRHLTFVSRGRIEPENEMMVRTLAWECCTYHNVEVSAGLCLQNAYRLKKFDVLALCEQAYGPAPYISADGKVRYEGAFNG